MYINIKTQKKLSLRLRLRFEIERLRQISWELRKATPYQYQYYYLIKMALNLCLSSFLIVAKSILKRFLLYVDKQIEAKLMLVDGRVSKSKKESRYGSYGFIISLSLLTKLPVETSYVKLQKWSTLLTQIRDGLLLQTSAKKSFPRPRSTLQTSHIDDRYSSGSDSISYQRIRMFANVIIRVRSSCLAF